MKRKTRQIKNSDTGLLIQDREQSRASQLSDEATESLQDVAAAEQFIDLARDYVEARRHNTDIYRVVEQLSRSSIPKTEQKVVLQAILNEAEVVRANVPENSPENQYLGEFFWILGSKLPARTLHDLNASKIDLLLQGHANNVEMCTEIAQMAPVAETCRPLDLDDLDHLSTTERLAISTKANTGKVLSSSIVVATLAQPTASFASEAPSTSNQLFSAADIGIASPQIAARNLQINIASPETSTLISARAETTPASDIDAVLGAAALTGGQAIQGLQTPSVSAQRTASLAAQKLKSSVAGSKELISHTVDEKDMTPEQSRERRKVILGITPLDKLSARANDSTAELSEEEQELLDAREALETMLEKIDSASDKGIIDPVTALEAHELAVALRHYTYDPTALDIFTKHEIKAILSHTYIGPQALAQKNQAVLETSNNRFVAWVTHDVPEADREFMMAAFASIDVTIMNKDALNNFADFDYASVSKFVDTKITSVEAPGSAGELSNMSEHEIDLLAAQNLAKRGDNWRNRGIALQFFLDQGFTVEQASGLIGNFVVESAGEELNPGIKQYGGGPGRGIVQWEESHSGGGGRANQLYRFAEQIGKPWDQLETQLQFVMWEFENTETGGYRALMSSDTVYDAADAILNFYERPAVRDVTLRFNAGKNIYNGFLEERAKILAGESTKTTKSTEDRIAELKEAGFTEQSTNMGGVSEMTPRTLNDGTRWHQYISQNSHDIKERLEKAGLNPDLGSLHMCGLVTIEMIRFSEDGAIAKSDDDMNEVYDTIIDDYIWARKHDIFTTPEGGAMWHAKMQTLAEHVGLDVQPLPTMTFDEIKRAFENGASYVTVNTNPEKLDDNAPIKSGHIFTIRGITKEGNLLILDPASYERTQKEWKPEQLLNYSDKTAMFAMSAPKNMDTYKQLLTNEKKAAETAAAEKAAKEKADKEAVQKAAAEREKKEAAARSKNTAPSTYDARIPKDWNPANLVDGWAAHQQTITSNPVSGKLDINQGQLEIVRSGYRENDLHNAEVMLKPDAAKAFRAMNAAYRAEFGVDLPINDSYRSFADQVTQAGLTPALAAIPGQSPHGWGNAFDANVGSRYSDTYNWLVQNGPIFGFYNPSWMNPASTHSPYPTKDEAWHFEFLGNAFILDDLVGGHPDYNMKEINKLYGNAG